MDQNNRDENLRVEEIERSDYLPAYRQDQSFLNNPEFQETRTKPWRVPATVDTTPQGRRIIGMDPNITNETLKELIKSDAKLISNETMQQILSKTPTEIIDEEFFHGHRAGVAHLSQCILEDLTQTKADLIARYSDDRRLPFVVGAFYLNTYLKVYKLSYFTYNTFEGYKQVEWKPRKVFIQPMAVLPLKKREMKKYYRATKRHPSKIPKCPECGSPARILRVGYRGKQVHVCCTDETGNCKWFLGTEPVDSETEAARQWRAICAEIRKEKVKQRK